MSLTSVVSFLARKATTLQVQSLEGVHNDTGRRAIEGAIAQALCVHAGCKQILLVLPPGQSLDRHKFRYAFGYTPRLIAPAAVEKLTGHPVNAVTPLGLAGRFPVYIDSGLRGTGVIFLRAGCVNHFVRAQENHLVSLTQAK